MCTGNFVESGNSGLVPPGTKCVGPCIITTGRWGKSMCWTNDEETQWGAECVACKSNSATAGKNKT